uniref:Uncharacterized protein n=1 Tax=Bionectria ochroleuca TaxID=29856 RepID=A0A0B7KT26_BIOOC
MLTVVAREINAGSCWRIIFASNLERVIVRLLTNLQCMNWASQFRPLRLSPALKDPYRWVIRDDQKKLFEPIFVKNLSSYSINTYRLLSNGVKREAFRAVPIDANSNNNLSESEDCSSSIIDQIQSENNSLLTQLNQTSTLLDIELRSRQLVEETNERLLIQQQVLEQQL